MTTQEIQKMRHDLAGVLYIVQTIEVALEANESKETLTQLANSSKENLQKIIEYFNQTAKPE